MTNDAISRSAAIEMLTEWPKRLGVVDPSASELFAERIGSLEALAAIRHEIDRLPALDVAPVVHARWIDPCINKYGHPCHHCSACRFKASKKDRNFCPNCGARMRGEDDET